MLDRKRAARSYHVVPGEDEERDVELGEGTGSQETGVVRDPTLDEEVDNWDENAWEEDEATEPQATTAAQNGKTDNGK